MILGRCVGGDGEWAAVEEPVRVQSLLSPISNRFTALGFLLTIFDCNSLRRVTKKIMKGGRNDDDDEGGWWW